LAGIIDRLKAGVEFGEEVEPPSFCGVSLEWFDFKNKRVALFSPGDLDLARWIARKGASTTYLCGPDESSGEQGITSIDHDIWDFPHAEMDYIFFDTRVMSKFHYVEDVPRLTERLQRLLSSSGNCFTTFRTGIVQAEWDVYNSVLVTESGVLPSSPFLYDELLKDFAVRPLLRLKDEQAPGCVTRVFRIAPRQPTILVILGQSQSGKTTLARAFRHLQPGAHFSSDYFYFNLFQVRGKLATSDYSPRLQKILGDATAEDTGNFFRSLEDDLPSFEEYLSLVVDLLPNATQLISMDLDLRRDDRVPVVKASLEAAGYSVWFVTR